MTDVIALSMNPSIDLSTSVDRVVPLRKLRCASARRDPGGGGVNVARVIGRFGADVTAVYPIGGATGQMLRRLVDQEGIRSLAIEIRGETREDFTVVEKTTGNEFRFVLPGPRLTKHEWRMCLDAIAALRARSKFLVASGSLPPGVPQDFYGQVARLAKEMSLKMVLDASAAALEMALKEGVYLIKPNLQELADLTGSRIDDQDAWIKAALSLVQAKQTEVVALTLGAEGALLITRDQVWRAQGLPVKPVSTVGAGDSFLGGLIWSLRLRSRSERCVPLRQRRRISGAAVTGHGTQSLGGYVAPLSSGGSGDDLDASRDSGTSVLTGSPCLSCAAD